MDVSYHRENVFVDPSNQMLSGLSLNTVKVKQYGVFDICNSRIRNKRGISAGHSLLAILGNIRK